MTIKQQLSRPKTVLISGIILPLLIVATAIASIKIGGAPKAEKVELCGKTYQIKPVFLNGVNIIQRIAEIETSVKYPTVPCGYLVNLAPNEALLPKLGKCKSYRLPYQCLQFVGGLFILDPVSRNIYLPGFDGETLYGNF